MNLMIHVVAFLVMLFVTTLYLMTAAVYGLIYLQVYDIGSSMILLAPVWYYSLIGLLGSVLSFGVTFRLFTHTLEAR